MDSLTDTLELCRRVTSGYVDQVVTRYGANSVTGRGAAAALGRLKLWGGGWRV